MTDGFFPSVGDTLAGKYQLTRELGRGSMGAVFEATHVRLAQRVAVKVMLPWVIERPELAYRFEQEARAAAQLRGPHTVRVLDVDTSPEGLPFLVMEHLAGWCLRQESEQRGPLPVEDAVRYVLEACEGMCEAHAAGIVHRDLKPSNLFLSDEGGRRVVKVLDFGVAKAFGDTNASYRTATNAHLGTYRYMSPEQARSARSVDGRSDVWSLGVVLYELLAGFVPFKGEGAVGTLVAIAMQAPPPLLERRPDMPAALVAVIERALCKDAGGRYQTMRDFADALAPFCQTGRPSSASISDPIAAPAAAPLAAPGTAHEAAADTVPFAAPLAAPVAAPSAAPGTAPMAAPDTVAFVPGAATPVAGPRSASALASASASAPFDRPLHFGASVSLAPPKGAGPDALPAPTRGGASPAGGRPPRRVPIEWALAPLALASLVALGVLSARVSRGALFARPRAPARSEMSADRSLGGVVALPPPEVPSGAPHADAAPSESSSPAGLERAAEASKQAEPASGPAKNPSPAGSAPAASSSTAARAAPAGPTSAPPAASKGTPTGGDRGPSPATSGEKAPSKPSGHIVLE